MDMIASNDVPAGHSAPEALRAVPASFTLPPASSDDDDHDVYYCDDCGKEPAVTQFIHLTKGEYFLCAGCWQSADHEEHYLQYCECSDPFLSDDCKQCWKCNREIYYKPYDEEDILCDQLAVCCSVLNEPVPSMF